MWTKIRLGLIMKTIYDEALEELKDVTTDLRDLEIIHSYETLCEQWQSTLREFQDDIFISNELIDELTKLVRDLKQYHIRKQGVRK